VVSLLLNLIYLACDLKSYNVGPTRDVSAVAVFLMWIKLLYFLRLFAPTAAFIRLVIQVFKDMFVFLFIYFIVLLSYSFTFFILSYDLYQSDPSVDPISNNLFNAFVYTHMQGLGNFNTTFFDPTKERILWYLLFLSQTLVVTIVLLQLLIAIICDTYDKVIQKREVQQLREVCGLMADYETIVNRD